MKKKTVIMLLIGAFVLFGAGTSNAAMENFITYTAEGAGISIDAKGLETSAEGSIRAEIPTGASVYKAYLYSADVWGSGPSNVIFEGNTLTADASSRLDVGTRNGTFPVGNPSEWRWDVTSIVQNKVGSGSGLFNFSLKELGLLDGEILAVLYNDPTKPVNTAIIFNGELSSTGDAFNISLTTPVDKTNPDFQAIMSLGISFGWQGTDQYSQVDVNGTRLTTSAGGQDDGYGSNGGLITAGGIGDSITNPVNPYQTATGAPRYDDELYNLYNFVKNGDTLISIRTLNPSNDDNVFFMGFTTLGKAEVHGVPEPATLLLLGFGLAGLATLRRKI